MKRLRAIRIVLLLAVVLVLGCLACALSRAREPRYQGRTLAEWIEISYSDRSGYMKKEAARNIIKDIGPDAIPLLLRWAQARDSTPKKKLINWLREHPSFNFKIMYADEYHFMAAVGFKWLGDEAKSAWPVLVEWTHSPDIERRHTALVCLVNSKPDKEILLPVLLRLIHDPDISVQRAASYFLHFDYPQDAETAGVYDKFPELKNTSTNRPNSNGILWE